MKIWWKQHTCNHIWKTDKELPMDDGKIEYRWNVTGGHLHGVKIRRWAQYNHCIKCKLEGVKEIVKSTVI